MQITASRLLLILALVAAVIGFVVSMGWFGATPDGNDLFALVFASLSFYFASILAP